MARVLIFATYSIDAYGAHPRFRIAGEGGKGAERETIRGCWTEFTSGVQGHQPLLGVRERSPYSWKLYTFIQKLRI